MNTADLWTTGPKMRPLRPGEALQSGQSVYVGDAAYTVKGWMLCGITRYALLDCGRCPVSHVALDDRVRVEGVGADDDGKQETRGARLRGRASTANARRRRA